MTRFAILCGSAPEDFRQKKFEEMFDFVSSKNKERGGIVSFPNGISEFMLEMVLNNSFKQLSNSSHSELVSESIKEILKQDVDDNDSLRVQHADIHNSNSILLYMCTCMPVKNNEKSLWLGGEEIRRDVIEHYKALAEQLGIDMQVVIDSENEMVSEEKLGYKKIENREFSLVSDNVAAADMPNERGEE